MFKNFTISLYFLLFIFFGCINIDNKKLWHCPNYKECGKLCIDDNEKKCPRCSNSKPEKQEIWDCPRCDLKRIYIDKCIRCELLKENINLYKQINNLSKNLNLKEDSKQKLIEIFQKLKNCTHEQQINFFQNFFILKKELFENK